MQLTFFAVNPLLSSGEMQRVTISSISGKSMVLEAPSFGMQHLSIRREKIEALSSQNVNPSTPRISRTLVTQEERWTLETARNAGAFIEGPNKVQLSHVVPNIEASWKTLSKEEQYGVFRQLEELQRKDWKELSLDEKKAGK